VATPNGLGVIDPDEHMHTAPVKPIIRDVRVNGKKFEIEQMDPLKNSERNLIIGYDCLDYKQLGNILYRYRIDETQDWHETKERAVNLLRLPAGTFVFEVQAKGADRTWSDSQILQFSIAAPFWRRIWFLLFVGLTVIGTLYSYTRSRLNKVQKEARIQQKITELERSALRAQMNPHFIFNVMHSIQGYIAEGDSSNATRLVSKFARLIRATLNHSRMTKIPLDDEIRHLTEYLDLETMRLNDGLTYQFHLGQGVDVNEIDIPPMVIQPFLENAIKHGITPKGGQGHIDIYLILESAHLIVEIIDNGIGIEQSLQRKKTAEDKHPSLGVSIVQERLSILEGRPSDEQITIKEMHDEQGDPIGTKVVLRIKLEEA
jgi:signal transduction histidine kinase